MYPSERASVGDSSGGRDLDDPRLLSVLYYGTNPWDSATQRPQQIAKRLAISNRIIYVNPIPAPLIHSDSHRYSALTVKSWPLELAKVLTRHSLHWRRMAPNLYVIDVPGLPMSSIGDAFHDFQMRILSSAVLGTLESRGSRPNVFWFSHPSQAAALNGLRPNEVCCYDCMDDHVLMASPSHRRSCSRNEKRILARADLVFASSKKLEDKCSLVARRVIRVPNGADYTHFAPRCWPTEKQSQKKESGPVLGFFGGICHWIDLDLVISIALMRPEWTIRMIGPCLDPTCDLMKRYANIDLVGEIPYETLPEYSNQFDVCIMPFKMDDFGESINPVKMYEYLATGLPIVSTDLAEARNLVPLLRVAKNAEKFVSQVEEALAESDESLMSRRIEFAKDNSWEDRIRLIEKAIVDEMTRSANQEEGELKS